MACSASHDAGYATPAAMVFALALALIATALVGRSVMQLRLAKTDLEKRVVEQTLDGAHLLAAATVVRASDGGPYVWSLATDQGFVEALAESEAEKLPLAADPGLTEATYQAMGVANSGIVRERLGAAPSSGWVEIGVFDQAPLWRECAPSLISPLGRATIPPRAPSEPKLRPETPDWRVGETWRVRITTSTGWRDDRIVRFTGDARRPVAVVRRQLSRGHGGQGRCDAVWTVAG